MLPKKARMCSIFTRWQAISDSTASLTRTGKEDLQMMPRLVRNGFTLVELLVVMAIISMLLSLAAPRYFKSVDKSKEAVLRENLATTRQALDKYFGDNGKYPDALDD